MAIIGIQARPRTLPWRGRVDAAQQRRGGVASLTKEARCEPASSWCNVHPTPDLRSDPPPPGEGAARLPQARANMRRRR